MAGGAKVLRGGRRVRVCLPAGQSAGVDRTYSGGGRQRRGMDMGSLGDDEVVGVFEAAGRCDSISPKFATSAWPRYRFVTTLSSPGDKRERPHHDSSNSPYVFCPTRA